MQTTRQQFHLETLLICHLVEGKILRRTIFISNIKVMSVETNFTDCECLLMKFGVLLPTRHASQRHKPLLPEL